jgi:hypothetical protein
MIKIPKKKEIDITPYHVRQQMWYMSLLKFYKTIEFNDKIYDDFAAKLLAGKIDQKTLKKLDTLRRKHKSKVKSGKKSKRKKQLVWDSILETYLDKSKKVNGYYINDGRIKVLYEERF